jgi:type IV secretion system protein VirB7
MTKTALLLVLSATLAGCASMTDPLPKCDGYSRRPLNRSMWEWEGDSKLKQQQSNASSSTSVTPFVEEASEPAAFAHLDIDGSYRRCEG